MTPRLLLPRNSRTTDSLRLGDQASSSPVWCRAFAACALPRNSRTTDSLRCGHRASSSPVWCRAFAACALLALAALAATTAIAADYTIDGAHSSVSFSVRHMMVTNVRGQFAGLKGTISFDPKNLAASKVDASVEAGSVNTGIVKRDDHLRSADFFDIAKFPTLSFKSTKWTREGGRIKVAGDLTMHGVTKAVVFDLEGPAPEVKSPDGGFRTGATVTGKINRQDFGLKWNKVMEGGGLTVSEEVSITLDIEATRK